jgi:endonuclease/exonuclease/phosphatase (EEP) superfamily protein YafD
VLRLVYPDGTRLLTCINAFTLYVYLPAYVCLAWAMWQRRWRLAACSGVIVAFHLLWVAPDFLPARRYRPPSPDSASAEAPILRIFYANVWTENKQYEAMFEEIAAADPDVIFFNEFSVQWEQAFVKSPLMHPYLNNLGLPRHRFSTIGLYTRLPVSDLKLFWTEHRPNCAFDVLVGDRKVRLFCLHGPRPFLQTDYDYHKFWTSLMALLERQPEPLIVVGDFNATQYSEVYRELTSERLRSAHGDVGRGYATTWPNGSIRVPPIRIDHALVSPEVECVRIVEGKGTGSDHRPLILEVRIHAAPDPSDDR